MKVEIIQKDNIKPSLYIINDEIILKNGQKEI